MQFNEIETYGILAFKFNDHISILPLPIFAVEYYEL